MNEITRYIHCSECVEAVTPGKISAGLTTRGIQIWCDTHDCNIVHFDFEGKKPLTFVNSQEIAHRCPEISMLEGHE